MPTKVMRTTQVCNNLRDNAGLRGGGIDGAVIGKGESLVIEVGTHESPRDGWVRIVGPTPPINPDGTYLKYGKQAWVELAHLEDLATDKTIFHVEVNWDTKTIRFI